MEPYQTLEKRWAEFNQLDVEGMVACSSGTAALHLALESLQLPPASEVITSDFNMIAVPRAIVMAGLSPMFVDCNANLNIDPELFEQAITYKTRAVIATHIYGRQCWMDCIAELAISSAQDVAIIEDLAEAHGVKPHRLTDAACWSFYKNKIVAGEEGGAVWFADEERADLARQLRSLGFTDAHDFTHIPRGHNYRMSNAHANLVLRSLDYYAFNRYRRRQVESAYDRACPQEWRMPYRDAAWVYDVRIPGMMDGTQNKIVSALNEQGIAARHAFKPMTTQREFGYTVGLRPNAKLASQEVIYLPITTEGTLYQDEERALLAFATIKTFVH